MPAIYQIQVKCLYYEGTYAEKTCSINIIPIPNLRKRYSRNFCWGRVKSLRPIEYTPGVAAIVFNLTVITTILCNRHLITKASMYLTAQLAFGVLFLALFSLTIANGHGIMSDQDLYQWRNHQRPYFRSLLTIGQTFEFLTSAAMTLERYFVTLYWMRPNLRIILRHVYFLNIFTCILTLLHVLQFSILIILR